MTCWSTKGWVGRASLCCSHTHHWKHNSFENGQSWSENFCWEETIQHMLLGKKWRREGGHHTIDFGLPLPDACKRQPLMEKSWPFCQFWWEPNPWNSSLRRGSEDLIDGPQWVQIAKSEIVAQDAKNADFGLFLVTSSLRYLPIWIWY